MAGMIKKIVCGLLDMPKTLYVNFKCLPVKQAVRLPILVDYRTVLGPLHKNITIAFPCPLFGIRLGIGGTESRDWGRKPYFSLGEQGRMIFHGRCTMAGGISLIVDRGTLEIGNGFFCNRNCSISCNSRIVIGDDNMWGWNIEVFDSDNHYLTHSKRLENRSSAPIAIGDHVWIAAFSHILKGAEIPGGSVVAYGSIVSGKFSQERVLLGGSPCRVLAEDTCWSREEA